VSVGFHNDLAGARGGSKDLGAVVTVVEAYGLGVLIEQPPTHPQQGIDTRHGVTTR
jgi:hypothetical protein